MTTSAYPVTPGVAPQAITDAGNAPLGSSLINRGDNGGTIWLQPGPSGQAGAVPLGPGGAITWTDNTTLPYVYLAGSATKPETLLVTDQSADYSNPVAVAAATATQLLDQGIPASIAAQINAAGVPNVLTGSVVWSVNDVQPHDTSVTALARGAVSPTFDVSKYASLFVHVGWSSPFGVGDYGPGALRFSFAQAGTFEGYGNTNWNVPDETFFTVPVIGPSLILSNRFAPIQFITIYGTNRPVAKFGHVGDIGGFRTLYPGSGGIPVAGTEYPLSAVDGLPYLTRHSGLVEVNVSTSSPGVLFGYYPTQNGSTQALQVGCNGGQTVFALAVPPTAPCRWTYRPNNSAASGSFCGVTIVQA